MKAKFGVRPDLDFWACEYGQFPGGSAHEVEADKGFVHQIASAHAHGSLVDVSYDAAAAKVAAQAVESEEDSLKALAKAQASGDWQAGNVEQYELGQAARAEGSDE